MKTEQEIRSKAEMLYYHSLLADERGNSEVSRSMQVRADLLLEYVLEMDQDQMEEVWNEAVGEYESLKNYKKVI